MDSRGYDGLCRVGGEGGRSDAEWSDEGFADVDVVDHEELTGSIGFRRVRVRGGAACGVVTACGGDDSKGKGGGSPDGGDGSGGMGGRGAGGSASGGDGPGAGGDGHDAC